LNNLRRFSLSLDTRRRNGWGYRAQIQLDIFIPLLFSPSPSLACSFPR
jgi:hypothetical protein